MLKYKKCESESIVKNGKVRGKQRYLCKECGYNFVEGDARTNEKIQAKKQCACFNTPRGRHLIICSQSSTILGHHLCTDG